MEDLHNNDLYADYKAYATGTLDVGDGHVLYFELSGNPKGLPLVFLHGGPGAGCRDFQRRYFNPEKFLVVQFDQRGAGRSTPLASTQANTTAHLVADVEALRHYLNIEKWLVSGGSWGTTLALAYGEQHPASCLGFLLRGVFLGTDGEVDWFLDGMKNVFPEAHADFSNQVGGLEGQALFDAYFDHLMDPDPTRHIPAARAWTNYELRCSTLYPKDDFGSEPQFDAYALTLARLEAHYFKHKLFLQPDQLIRQLEPIKALPAIIVQGRYDMVCPIQSAYRLHVAWPGSKLVVIPDAGHSGLEPGICRALTRGANELAQLLIQTD